METWKDIKGYEGIYQVSDKGNIKSLDRKQKNKRGRAITYKGKLLKQTPNSKGYLRVMLKRFGTKEQIFVHRLVAIHFVANPNPLKYNIVNHLDSNFLNNCAENLEWTTLKGNSQHAAKAGRLKRTAQWLKNLHKAQEKTYKPVEAIDKSGNLIVKYNNLNDCKKDGYQPSCVSNCCTGKRKTHKGLYWRYSCILGGGINE